jgi:PhnB protein
VALSAHAVPKNRRDAGPLGCHARPIAIYILLSVFEGNSARSKNLAVSSISRQEDHMAPDSPAVSHSTSRAPTPYSIAPWLSVRNGARAVEFYKAAFGAVESHRLEDSTGAVVAKLTVNGAVFWVSGESPEKVNTAPEVVGCGTVRMVLIVPDPDAAFARALKAGASQVFPVGEEHGWRLGRVVDPFGLHWEIGYELSK